MIIGVPKEIKNHEYRVGMAVASVRELTARNHTVFAQSGAGSGIDSGGADYRAATVAILSCIAAIFTAAGLSVRLKTPPSLCLRRDCPAMIWHSPCRITRGRHRECAHRESGHPSEIPPHVNARPD
ncbi:hypothetical protein ACV1EC_00790 [Aeromonas hydrophila]